MEYLTAGTAVAALVLGLLYALGAVLIAGQLRATHVPTRDVLPLIPLPQMLGRGMSALLAQVGPVLFFAVWLVGSIWFGHFQDALRRGVPKRADALSQRLESIKQEVPEVEGETSNIERHGETIASLKVDVDALVALSRAVNQPRRWTLVFVAATSILVILFTDPAFMTLSLLAMIPIALDGLRMVKSRVATAAVALLIALAFLMSAYYYPQRLPRIEATMITGQVIRGTLVAQTDRSIYLTSVPRSVQVIPTDRVQFARIESQPKRKYPSLFKYVKRRVGG